jgi:hypothetical protein
MGYVSAAVALIGLGMQAYGYSEAQGAGKLSRRQKQAFADQAEREKDNARLQRMLQPFVLDQMGLEAEFTSTGAIKALRKKPQTEEQKRAAEIRRLAEERTIKALKGELDIDPGATRAFNEDQRRREEYLARTLGPDYKASSAGATALERGLESRRIAENAIRRGELTTSESVAQGRITDAFQQQQFETGLLRGLPFDTERLISAQRDSLDQDVALVNRNAAYRIADANRISSIGGGLTKLGASFGGGSSGGGLMAGTGGVYGGSTPATAYGSPAWDQYRASERSAGDVTPYYAYQPTEQQGSLY